MYCNGLYISLSRRRAGHLEPVRPFLNFNASEKSVYAVWLQLHNLLDLFLRDTFKNKQCATEVIKIARAVEFTFRFKLF